MNFQIDVFSDRRCRACYIGETTSYNSYVIQAQRIRSQMYEDSKVLLGDIGIDGPFWQPP